MLEKELEALKKMLAVPIQKEFEFSLRAKRGDSGIGVNNEAVMLADGAKNWHGCATNCGATKSPRRTCGAPMPISRRNSTRNSSRSAGRT